MLRAEKTPQGDAMILYVVTGCPESHTPGVFLRAFFDKPSADDYAESVRASEGYDNILIEEVVMRSRIRTPPSISGYDFL